MREIRKFKHVNSQWEVAFETILDFLQEFFHVAHSSSDLKVCLRASGLCVCRECALP